MKTLLPGLLAVASGFAVSRLIPWDATASPAAGGLTLSAPVLPPGYRPAALEKAAVQFSPDVADWQGAAKAWGESDPAGFYRWLVKRGIPPGNGVLQELFAAWARRDPEAAFGAVFNLPSDFQRQQEVMDGMLNAVMDQPGGLAVALRWSPAVDEQIYVIHWPGADWMKASPPQQIAAVLAEKASGFKYGGVLARQFASFWAGQDPTAALSWAGKLSPEQHAAAMEGIMQSWAEKDPASALNYLSRDSTSGDRFNSFRPLRELAKTDPKAAINWWENNLGVASPNSLNSIFSPWCEANAGEARDYALAMEDPTLRRNCLAAWGEQAMSEDVRAAIGEVQDERNRTTLIETLARSSQDRETGTFLRQLVETGDSGVTLAVVGNVSRQYTYKEPAAAFAWTGTLPENLQSAAVGMVIGTWRDQVAAAQAVSELPEGTFKDSAQQALRNKLNSSGR